MRKITTLLFLTIALCALSLTAATPDTDVHAAIKKYRQSLLKKDVAALEQIWSDDYVFVNGHGQLRTKADRIADIESGHSSIDSITHEETPTVTTHGTTTLVLSRVTIVGKYSGRDVSHEFRSLHVWMNENGRWRLVYNQLTPVE
jgi:ketosteroid isomerase-like protein